MVVTSAIILACLALAELSCDRKRTVTTQNLSEDVGADLPAVDVLKIKDVYTSPDTNNVSDAEGLPESEISEEIQDTYQEVHPPSEYEKCLKLKINKTGDDIKAGLPFAGCLDEVSLAMYPDITLCVKAYAYLIPMPGVSQVQLEAFGGPDNLMGYGLTYTLERFFDTTDEEDRIWFNYEWILCPKCMDPDEGASVEPSHWILPPKFISRYRPIKRACAKVS